MSIGPLTTTFTPEPSCTSESYGWWYYNSRNLRTSPQVTATDADVEWYLSLGPSVWRNCMPSSYKTGASYFSPGICPDGYTAAGQTSLAIDNEVVTAATCCPQGYNAQTGNDNYWYSTNQCSSSNTDTAAEYTYTQGNVVTSYTGAYGVNAKGISIRWKSDDFASSTSSTSSTSTNTNTGSNNGSGSSAGLSPGAKAGIGVGVGVGVPLLLGVFYLIYLVRRNTARKEAAAATAGGGGISAVSGPTSPQPQPHPGYMPVNNDYGQQNMYAPSYEMSSDTHKDTPPQEMSTLRQ